MAPFSPSWFRSEVKERLTALEQELRQLREQAFLEDRLHRSILDRLAEGVMVFDAGRGLRLFNPAARRLLKAGHRMKAGDRLEDLFPEPEVLRHLESAYGGDTTEWTLRREPRALRVRAMPFENGGEAQGILMTLDDITRQEALETTRQKFISNASHELKTPVTSIRIATENLMDGQQVLPEGQGNLGSILRAVDRMVMLLNDISELSRIETGALALEPKSIDLGLYVEQVVEDLSPQAEGRGVKLVSEVEPDLAKVPFLADPLRLHQLLENLLSNAVKFSPQGGVVSLRVRKERDRLLWEVADQGVGIAPEEQHRIFERFYRSAKVRGVPGTGLGLAIVKHLVRLMEGEIELRSAPGKGSTFIVKLPLG